MLFYGGLQQFCYRADNAKHIFYLKGLSQNHKKTNGLGHNQKAVGEFVLLEWERMYSGFQYYVHQLLRLQQARRGCCSYGTGSRKIVSYKGIFVIIIKISILS